MESKDVAISFSHIGAVKGMMHVLEVVHNNCIKPVGTTFYCCEG